MKISELQIFATSVLEAKVITDANLAEKKAAMEEAMSAYTDALVASGVCVQCSYFVYDDVKLVYNCAVCGMLNKNPDALTQDQVLDKTEKIILDRMLEEGL